MTIESLISQIKNNPQSTSFQEVIAVIDTNYHFTPTAFSNGNQVNKAGENNGSCKIFAFAKLHQLNELQTLACFGSYYFEDVLKNPAGTDHQNIRNFTEFGWEGIHFKGTALDSLQ